MQIVNVYIDVSIRGPRRRNCKYGYVLEMATAKGPATLDKIDKLEDTTEHQAVLRATIEALKRIKKPCHLVIFTDSEYLAVSTLQGWVLEWSRKNWINAKGKQVANVNEWKELIDLLNKNEFEFKMNQPHSYKEWLQRELNKEES